MLSKGGRPLRDLVDWGNRAGPKRRDQWKDHHSAKECARAWLDATPALPSEIVAALSSHPDFGRVLTWAAEPEARLPLDGRRGEPRNTDLLVEATDSFGPLLIAVEAKAGEAFDAPIGTVLAEALEHKALEHKIAAPRSGALDRAVDLASALLGPKQASQAGVGTLRYQLFTGAVGALRAAEDRGLSRAVLVIHAWVVGACRCAPR